MKILVDTSVWIDYFRSGTNSEQLDILIDENLIVTNDVILTELVPFLKAKSQRKIILLLYQVMKLSLEIDWEQIIKFQVKCLKFGINGLGIPDLLIAQNSKQNKCSIYSLDGHFRLLKPVLGLKLFE